MKEYIRMVVFIIILGSLAAGVLIGMDALTKTRIEANKKLEFQQTVLDANDTPYTLADIEEIFNQYIIVDERIVDGITYTLYTHNVTNNVSFTFRGNGLWGDIYGMLTLKEDFKTIVEITILEQEETPGLGAIVGEREYLNKYVGKIFDPKISIVQQATSDSEVDRVTGATGTSNAFQKILNDTYGKYYTEYISGGVLPEDDQLMVDVLNVNGYSIENDNRPLVDIFNGIFRVHATEELKLFEDLTTGKLTYSFESEFGFDELNNIPGPIIGLVVLESDFITIDVIKVLKHNENMGTSLLEDKQLAKAKGKKFPNISFVVDKADANEHELDGIAGVTKTTTVLTAELNRSYNEQKLTFGGITQVNSSNMYLMNILVNNKITLKGNDIETFFDSVIVTEEQNGLTLYRNKANDYITFAFESENGFKLNEGDPSGPISGILTLESDFATIAKIKVLSQMERRGAALLTDEHLESAIGKKFPNIIFVEIPVNDNEIDTVTGITKTVDVFSAALNATYDTYANEFDFGIELSDDAKQVRRDLLEIHNYDLGNNDLETFFNSKFIVTKKSGLTIYTNRENSNVSFAFESENGFKLKEEDPSGPISGILTLESDFETIANIKVLEHIERRGAALLTDEHLESAIGKKFPNIIFVENPVNDNEIDTVTGVTKTVDVFTKVLNDIYTIYADAFKGGA